MTLSGKTVEFAKTSFCRKQVSYYENMYCQPEHGGPLGILAGTLRVKSEINSNSLLTTVSHVPD